jgi:2-polyprenyl-6-methoxyphenol hydroxylase-like FAD-dependent oxidoreductase
MREERMEVLVVGAGPVGLLTAILLAEAGITVTITDREARPTARSYACALHSRTLKLLSQMGLAAAVLERGRRVQTVAFYDGASRARPDSRATSLASASAARRRATSWWRHPPTCKSWCP